MDCADDVRRAVGTPRLMISVRSFGLTAGDDRECSRVMPCRRRRIRCRRNLNKRCQGINGRRRGFKRSRRRAWARDKTRWRVGRAWRRCSKAGRSRKTPTRVKSALNRSAVDPLNSNPPRLSRREASCLARRSAGTTSRGTAAAAGGRSELDAPREPRQLFGAFAPQEQPVSPRAPQGTVDSDGFLLDSDLESDVEAEEATSEFT